jgi:hypothetical protein
MADFSKISKVAGNSQNPMHIGNILPEVITSIENRMIAHRRKSQSGTEKKLLTNQVFGKTTF